MVAPRVRSGETRAAIAAAMRPRMRFGVDRCGRGTDIGPGIIAASGTATRPRPVRSLRCVESGTVRVNVEYDERYWYPDEGGQVWLAGYFPVDASSGRYLARDGPELAALGLRVVGVAGAGRHHAAAVATEAAEPGRRLELRRDLANPHDVNAIAVHGEEGGEQLGWVPREVAAELAPELDEGRPWSAVALREQRRSPRDPRHGLTMLLAPAAAIELSVAGGGVPG
jgi:HIRAN domain